MLPNGKLYPTTQLVGATLMHVCRTGNDRWKGLHIDKGKPKNQPSKIILALDLKALMLNNTFHNKLLLRFNPTVN